MKTELKRKLFNSAASLCKFVIEYNITKENILLLKIQASLFYFIGR